MVDAAGTDIPDCANDGRALQMYGWGAVTVSPDGRNLYAAAANSDALAVFDRDTDTGAIAQKAGTAGCISNDAFPQAGCATARAHAFPSSIAISPDGRHAYVAAYSSSAITVFDRDAATGALLQKPGTSGCVVDPSINGPVTNCDNTGRAMVGAHTVVVSPDGLNVYLVSDGTDSVSVFDRDTTTGVITQKAGAAGCVVHAPQVDVPNCDNSGLAMSFSRDLALSPDGKSLYVAALGSDAIAVFDRDALTGAIAQKALPVGCVVNGPSTDVPGCDNNTARGLDGALGVVVAPDGTTVHVAGALSNAVATFDRANDGTLTQKAGVAGCLVDEPSADIATCDNTGRALLTPEEIDVSPDGQSVYVPTGSHAIVTFDRNSGDGALAQRAGTGGCLVDEPSADIATCDNSGRGLNTPSSVAVSPDGASVYAEGAGSNSVVGFRRDLVPVCEPLATVALHNSFTPITLACRDPNGDPMTFAVTAQPAHGSAGPVSQAAAEVVYAPALGYAGPDAFNYSATANGATSDAVPVNLDVLPGQPPVCVPQARSVGAGTTTTLALSCAAGGDPFTIAIGSAPSHGSLGAITQASGFVDYTPTAGFSGNDAFDYSATSNFGQSAAAPFALTVLAATSGPQGPQGPQGTQGPIGAQGSIGPVGPPAFKLEVALFSSRLRAKPGKPVAVRYVSTLAARVELAVVQKSKVLARVTRNAKVGANAIVWNGRIGKKAARPGVYQLRLRATNGDQDVTRTSSLTVAKLKR